jgi:hypothetical protein
VRVPCCCNCEQAEATYWGTPRVEAFQLDGSLAALDLLPLLAPTPAPPAPSSMPGRLTTSAMAGSGSGSSSGGVGGGSGGLLPAGAAPKRLRASGQLVARGTRDTSLAARRQQAVLTSPESGFLFTGEWGAVGGGGRACWRAHQLLGSVQHSMAVQVQTRQPPQRALQQSLITACWPCFVDGHIHLNS